MMRKWINLLNEFAPEDFSGDGSGDGREMVEVTGICWYERTEDQDEVYSDDLPTEVTLALNLEREENDGNQSLAALSTIQSELEDRYGDKYNASPMFFDYRFI